MIGEKTVKQSGPQLTRFVRYNQQSESNTHSIEEEGEIQTKALYEATQLEPTCL
jgi:hypothetical protein